MSVQINDYITVTESKRNMSFMGMKAGKDERFVGVAFQVKAIAGPLVLAYSPVHQCNVTLDKRVETMIPLPKEWVAEVFKDHVPTEAEEAHAAMSGEISDLITEALAIHSSGRRVAPPEDCE